jgi:hypothetical protein
MIKGKSKERLIASFTFALSFLDSIVTYFVNSSAISFAPKTFRNISSMPRESTEIARLTDSSKTKFPTSDWILPSKIKPTSSAFLLIAGEPELPPIMSLVETKLNGVFKPTTDFLSTHRGGRLYGNSALCSVDRAKSPPSVVNGVIFVPFSK